MTSSSSSSSSSPLVTLILRNPYFPLTDFSSSSPAQFSLTVPISSTISQIKTLIESDYSLHPISSSQRILFSGRLCDDDEKIENFLPNKKIEKISENSAESSNKNELNEINSSSNEIPSLLFSLIIKSSSSKESSNFLFSSPEFSGISPFSPAAFSSMISPSIYSMSSNSLQFQLALAQFAAAQRSSNFPSALGNNSPPPSATAGQNSTNEPAAAPVAAVPILPPRPLYARLSVFLDFRVLLRLFVIYMLFGQESGDSYRAIFFFTAIVVAYLFQVWKNGQRIEEIRRRAAPNAAGGAGPNDDDAIRQQLENEFQPDLQREREELEYFAQLNRLNRIRNADENGENIRIVGLESTGFFSSIKNFVRGFFASLSPSWRPQIPEVIEIENQTNENQNQNETPVNGNEIPQENQQNPQEPNLNAQPVE